MNDMVELTPIDRAMLAELRRNGRASITELAGALGVSRATAKVRLDRLIESGTIRRFTIDTDLEDRQLIEPSRPLNCRVRCRAR